MHITQYSLLARLHDQHPQAWQEFSAFYQPMIANWLRSYSLQAADIEDLSQEIMLFVAQHIHEFEHNGRIGAFRNWLRSVTVNVARNYLRKIALHNPQLTHLSMALEQLADPESNQSRLFNLAHDRFVVQLLLHHLSEHFQAETLTIFKLHVIDEWSAQETAAKMQVSVASVHVAKSRVLRRLRQDAKDWLDDLPFLR
jgi:RNA polymerase sigma-70 factor, ECF subfamily